MNFEWNEECVDRLEKWKNLIKNAPISKIVNLDKEFVVFIDAYMEGLGRVLMQEGQAVCFESRKLNEHEHNYVTHDLEFETIFMP